MADLIETIVIPEVPRVLDGQELYVYIPERKVNSYTKEETDALLATKVPTTRTIAGVDLQDDITKNELVEALGVDEKFDKSNVTQTTGNSTSKVMSQKVVTEELDGKLDKALIPSEYLPSYVDDVVEYSSKSAFPATGETGKIYVDTSTNLTYRWSGSTYIQVGGANLNLENGTGDILIQTTDTIRSFKVMTDGRAQVYREPTENDDVIRLKEFSVLTQSQVDLLF